MSFIKSSLFIFYVKDQDTSTAFYKKVLNCDPILNVPGMTEFKIGDNVLLGLMPVSGIKSLLGDSVEDPLKADGIPRAELYLSVEDASLYHKRALSAGAVELSPVTSRNWGEDVGYSKDHDAHILAFGQRIVK